MLNEHGSPILQPGMLLVAGRQGANRAEKPARPPRRCRTSEVVAAGRLVTLTSLGVKDVPDTDLRGKPKNIGDPCTRMWPNALGKHTPWRVVLCMHACGQRVLCTSAVPTVRLQSGSNHILHDAARSPVPPTCHRHSDSSLCPPLTGHRGTRCAARRFDFFGAGRSWGTGG